MNVDSRFGSVDISVPDTGETYAVSVSTEFGDSTNRLRTDPTSGSTIDVASKFGRVTLGYAP
ncbi:MAG: hypothetical protein JJE52_02020 [Acidimicrobiia bacterium]|nr:hypothetical protein [Acidimicrobiia bacterium]